jgi:hypothetical protein
MARCPHCQAELPEAASFCAKCGRRIEGWSATPHAQSAADDLPSSESPTRRMEPPPSLKRNATEKPKAPSETGPVETDSALMRTYKRNRAPILVGLLLLGAGAGTGAFFLVRRHVVAPPPPKEVAKVTPAPAPAPPPVAPPAKVSRRTKGPHRVAPMNVPSKKEIAAAAAKPAPPAPKKPDKGGALPHKAVATDSRPQPAGKEPSPPPKTDSPGETPFTPKPPTDDELRKQAEDEFDAESVRQIVQSHMPQVRACYEHAFKFNSPGGRVEVAFTISQAGKPSHVRTESNSTESDVLSKCLEDRVREWQFPHTLGGDTDLIYPFVFSAGS